jgi:CBS domain-containing protein
VIYADVPEAEQAIVRESFAAILASVRRYLEASGLRGAEGPGPRCLPWSAWKLYYGELIANPIAYGIWEVRSLFDFRPIKGDRGLVKALQESIAAGLQNSDMFVPVLANDTLGHLPPMTFFRGLVVELDGAERNTLDIEQYALQPVEDAARVLALAARKLDSASTLERLESAGLVREDQAMFEEAREAFRVASFHFATARFRNPGNAVIDPSSLGRYDQRLLKTAFQSIRRLLEFTATTFIGATEL